VALCQRSTHSGSISSRNCSVSGSFSFRFMI
jgi:hypothetical protein